MKYLILGGAGFIGQHLAHTLLRTRHNRVVAVDNLSTSSLELEDYRQYKNLYEFIESDITTMDDSELLKLIKKADVVFHLAGSVGVEHIDKHPRETLHNNVNLMNKLIPLFEQTKTHVVFASTSEVYGNGPFTENSNATIGSSEKLRWGYATAKLMTEFMIRAGNYPYNIVRFFNVVGPGQLCDYGMVLPRFVKAAKANEPLVVYGSGKQVRSFCHVDDAIQQLLGILHHPNELFNIGNSDNTTTISDLAQLVIDTVGSSSTIQYVDYDEAFSKNHGDIDYRVCSTEKTYSTIKFEPMFSTVMIIEDMI